MENKCIILVGMHRSATSFSASVLQKAGVDIGERLWGESKGNDFGHFENIDFHDFHSKILINNNLHHDGWTPLPKEIYINEDDKRKAIELIKINENKIWCWKDPRTTLFLDLWLELLPDAKFVCVFREPWEVIDSVFRRGDIYFENNPFEIINSWFEYNSRILQLLKENPNNTILLHSGSIIDNPKYLFENIKQKFTEFNQIKNPNILANKSSFKMLEDDLLFYIDLMKKYNPEAIKLYVELIENATWKFLDKIPDNIIQPLNVLKIQPQHVFFQNFVLNTEINLKTNIYKSWMTLRQYDDYQNLKLEFDNLKKTNENLHIQYNRQVDINKNLIEKPIRNLFNYFKSKVKRWVKR